MKRLIIAVTSILLSLSAVAHAAWHEVKTPNFTIRGDASRGSLLAVAEELEQFRLLLGIIVAGKVPPPEPVNVPVYIMATGDSFVDIFGSDRAAGVFTSRIDSPIFVGNAARRPDASMVRGQKDDSGRAAAQTIKHEYVHHFTYMNGPTYYPIWYSEGFADYFSTFEFERGVATVGQLHSIRGSWLVNSPSLLPWTDVFNSMLGWAPSRERDAVSKYYAQSWLAVHYLLNHPEERSNTAAYLAAIKTDPSAPLDTFERHFGRTADEVGKQIDQYLKSNRLPVQRYDLSAYVVEGAYEARRLDDWEADFAYAYARRFFMRDAEDRTEVADILERVIAKKPDFVPALVELAHLRLQQEDKDAARAVVALLEERAPDDADVLVLKGLTEPGGEARRFFEQAIARSPNHPLALYQYASTFGRYGATEKALDAAIQAMVASANRNEVPLLVGELLVGLGYKDDARAILSPLVHWSRDAGIRSRARRLLSDLAH